MQFQGIWYTIGLINSGGSGWPREYGRVFVYLDNQTIGQDFMMQIGSNHNIEQWGIVMGDRTNINYVDSTWNPADGCSPVSDGCSRCFASDTAKRFWKDRLFSHIRTHPDRLDIPLHWRKPRRVLVPSMGDLFHKDVPDAFIDRVIMAMYRAHWHDYYVLTKRPDRMARLVLKALARSHTLSAWIPERWNIYWGISIEDQATADTRIQYLLQIPGRKWLSVEPLLGLIDLCDVESYANWIVCGCESGPKRRPCKMEWVYSIVEQCVQANIPVWVKQLDIGGRVIHDIQKFPKDLQRRERP